MENCKDVQTCFVDDPGPEGPRAPEYPPFVQRLLIERSELDEKLSKLNSFLLTKTFDNLTNAEKYLLGKQVQYMNSYRQVLDARISIYVKE